MNEVLIPFKPGKVTKEKIKVDINLEDVDIKKSFPFLLDVSHLSFSYKAKGNEDCYLVTLYLEGEIELVDSHDSELVHVLSLEDSLELTLMPHDEENSDLPLAKDGSYDLYPAFLSLLFDALPRNYSETDITREETEDYLLLSEKEAEKEKDKAHNPFADL